MAFLTNYTVYLTVTTKAGEAVVIIHHLRASNRESAEHAAQMIYNPEQRWDISIKVI